MEFNNTVYNNEKGAEMIILYVNNIVLLDISAIIILIVLAYLSKRLGEALKTASFYKCFYIGIALIVIAALLNTILAGNNIISVKPLFSNTLPMAIRTFSGFIAVFVCLQYWKWLFPEFFKH